MVVIRLARKGAKNRPFYHVVVANSRAPRDGKFIEKLGFLDPLGETKLKLNIERIEHWLKTGAQPSTRIRDLITEYKKSTVAVAA